MKLLILSSLPFDILLYGFFIPVLSYGIGVVATRPYIASPQHRFDFGMAQEYLFRCNTFYRCYYPSYIIRWNTLHQKMNMIIVRSNLNKNNLVSLLNPNTRLFQCCRHLSAKYLPAVFCRTYDMVQQQGLIMTFEYVFTHIINLHILPRPRGSGNSID